MTHDRRTFLKTTGLVGMAAMTGAGLTADTDAVAQTAAGANEPKELPKGMTFATLRRPDGLGLGLRTDRGVLDVVAAEQDFREGAPTTIDAVFKGQGDINGLKRLADKARAALATPDLIRGSGQRGNSIDARAGHSPEEGSSARASASADRYFVAVDKAVFGPCVTNPEKIICIGLNYRKHIAEMNAQVPKMPVLFSKYNTALNNHGGTVGVTETDGVQFDYEAELVIVIGRTARNVSEADAANYIFGYATGNDFTARDLQRRSTQWLIGKSLDGSAPVGPWLVTADIADGDNLKIECRVNGEIRQSSNTSDMVFDCKQLVSYSSKYFTLRPGDLIFTGTPEGVIAGYPKDKQVWLKAGDKVVTSIEKLGELSFTLT